MINHLNYVSGYKPKRIINDQHKCADGDVGTNKMGNRRSTCKYTLHNRLTTHMVSRLYARGGMRKGRMQGSHLLGGSLLGEDLGQLGQVRTHLVGEAAQADRSEEVDAEAHVARRVLGEDTFKPLHASGVLQPLV